MNATRTDSASDSDFLLTIEGGAASPAAVQFMQADDEKRLRGILASAGSRRVWLSALDEAEVEGHAFRRAETATVKLILDGDEESDTEGHAISLRFPTMSDAEAFRTRLLMGAAIGTLMLAGAAAGVGNVAQPTSLAGPAAAPAPVAVQRGAEQDLGIADRASQSSAEQAAVAPAVPASRAVPQGADQDLGISDQASQSAAEEAAGGAAAAPTTDDQRHDPLRGGNTPR